MHCSYNPFKSKKEDKKKTTHHLQKINELNNDAFNVRPTPIIIRALELTRLQQKETTTDDDDERN